MRDLTTSNQKDDVLGKRVLVPNSSLVKIIGDAFIPRLVREGTRLTRNREERLEGLLVKVTLRVLGGLVGHQCRRECVTGRRDEDASELGEEEVWIVLNGGVEAGLAKREEGGVLLGRRLDRGQLSNNEHR